MSLSPQFLDELRARVPVSEIAAKRLKLTRAGREFKACCPFHGEKTPSFYINDQKGFFHCFGCGAHGDVLSFVMRHDNLAFMEAVELLAGEAGLDVPKPTREEAEKVERQKTLYDLIDAAARFFEAQLKVPAGRQGLDYFRRRGLDDEAIARFRLGYAPQDAQALIAALKRDGYEEPDMIEAGLVRRADDGRLFSFFRHRVMFPVGDRRDRIVAFGGRLMEGDGPKYINTGDTPLFHKGQLLYNMASARKAAADGQPLIVVEGYMDVIALVRAGWDGAVAPLGTALTENQIEALWKLQPGGRRLPILCFDGDGAGRRAAARAADRILPMLKPDHSVRVAFLPEGEDPDSLLKTSGPAAMRTVLEEARDLAALIYAIEREATPDTTPESMAGLKARLNDRASGIQNADVQQAYRSWLMERFFNEQRQRPAQAPAGGGAPGGWQPREGRSWGTGGSQGRGGRRGGPPPVQIQRKRPGQSMPSSKELLLAIVLVRPAIFDYVAEPLGHIEFAADRGGDGRLDNFRQKLISALSEAPDLDSAALSNQLSLSGYDRIVAELREMAASHARYALGGVPDSVVLSRWNAQHMALQRDHLLDELKEAGRMRLLKPDSFAEERVAELHRQIEHLDQALNNLGEDDDQPAAWTGSGG
jgi:DNA primase